MTIVYGKGSPPMPDGRRHFEAVWDGLQARPNPPDSLRVEAARRFLASQGMRPDLVEWTVTQPDCALTALAEAGGWKSDLQVAGENMRDTMHKAGRHDPAWPSSSDLEDQIMQDSRVPVESIGDYTYTPASPETIARTNALLMRGPESSCRCTGCFMDERWVQE